MEPLIKTLPAILRAGGDSDEVIEAAAIAAWKYIAGTQLSQQAVGGRVSGKTLFIAVADAIWKKQLESMAGQLLFRLNSVLGQPVISRLEFWIDPSIEQVATRDQIRDSEIENTANDVSLELWQAANAIHDKQLRQVFLKAAGRNMRGKERK